MGRRALRLQAGVDAAIGLYVAGSCLRAVETAGELIAFRVLQAWAGDMVVPIGFTLVAQRAGPQRVGRALAVLGLPVLLAQISGPIVGGVIIDEASLQWVFVANLPIATVAIAAVALERDVRPVRRLDDPHRGVRVARRSLARRLIDVGLFRSPRFRAAALGGRVSPLRSSGRSLRRSFTTSSSAAGARCGRGAIPPIAGV